MSGNYNHREELSIWKAYIKAGAVSVPRGLSFTFSFSLVAIAILIGHLDDENKDDNVAASLLIVSMMAFLFSVFSSPIYGLNKMTSETQDKAKISDSFKSGVLVAAGLSIFPIAGTCASKWILTSVGIDEKHAQLAQQGLLIAAAEVPAFMFRMLIEMYLFSFERQNAAMLIGLCTFGIGIGVAYGLGQHLGIRGVMIGFLIESWLTFLIFLGYLLKNFKDYKFLSNWNCANSRGQIKDIMINGLPISATLLFESISTFIFALIANKLDDSGDTLTAQAFVAQYQFLILVFTIAFGLTAYQEVSREIGNKKYTNAARFTIGGLLSSVSFILPFSILVACLPQIIISMVSFSVNDNSLAMAKNMLPIMVAGVILDNIRNFILQALRGAGDPVIPTLISVGSIILSMAFAALLAFTTSLREMALPWSFTVNAALAVVLLAARAYYYLDPQYLAIKHKNVDTVERSLALGVIVPNPLNLDPSPLPSPSASPGASPPLPIAAPASPPRTRYGPTLGGSPAARSLMKPSDNAAIELDI